MSNRHWYDLSAYHLAAEAWEKNDRYYLVVFGNVDEHEGRLKAVGGGRRIALFNDPDLPAWVFGMPPARMRERVPPSWQRQFPKMKVIDMPPGRYTRTPDRQRRELIREAVARLVAEAEAEKASIGDIQAETAGRRLVAHVEDGRVLEEVQGAGRRMVVNEYGLVVREEPPYPNRMRVDPLYARPGPLEEMDPDLVRDLFLMELRQNEGRQWTLEEVQAWIAGIAGEAPSRVRDAGLPDRALQEALEAAVMQRATEIAATQRDEDDARRVFEEMVGLYERQPRMEVRSTRAMNLGQYSTPAPMGWALQYAVGLTPEDLVLEPTFGTGSLVTMASPERVIGREVDERRVRLMARRYPGIRLGDFLEMEVETPVDVVLANPPFSSSRPVNETFPGGLRVRRIDRLIALRALEAMRPEGRAALILAVEHPAARSGGFSKAEKHFNNYLYDHYNVVDHFEVAGDLYARQGTKYGVQVIVIDGRRPEPVQAETPDRLPAVSTYDELFDRAKKTRGLIHERRQEEAAAEVVQDSAPLPGGPDDGGLGDPGAAAGGQGVRGQSHPGGLEGSVAVGDEGAAEPGADGSGDRRVGHPADRPGASAAVRGAVGEERGGPGGSAAAPGSAGDLPGDADHALPGAGGGAPEGAAGGEAGDRAADHADAQNRQGVGGRRAEGRGEARALPGGGHEPDGAVRGDARRSRRRVEYANRLQARYRPAARAPALNTNIPANLELPVRRALERVEARHGDLVEYVADRLRMPQEQVREVFYAEQIDALALALDQYEQGRGFVLGDMTGVGKTRVLVGVMVRALIDGRVPVFITHKANLFKDIMIEAEAMGVGYLFNPAVINNTRAIRNEQGEILVAPVEPQLLDEMYEKNTLLDYNGVFITYSQLNRKESRRATWLREVLGDQGVLILDESHQAGGMSNTGANVFHLTTKAGFVLYSSATYAKRPDNYLIYHRVMGSRAARAGFSKTMKKGGEPLQEILSSMMAEDGTYIRREHDYSYARFNTYLDMKNSAAHRAAADQLARILGVMTAITGEIGRSLVPLNEAMKKELDRIRKDLNERELRVARKMGIAGNNFASRLWNISGQFMLALKVDAVAELAAKAIREGRAPVIFLDNTMETFLSECLEHAREMSREELFDDAGMPDAPYTFSDVLKRTVRKLVKIRVTDRYGEQKEYDLLDDEWMNDALLRDLDPEIQDRLTRLTELVDREIDRLPEVPLSPLDAIHARLAKEGYTLGELTGRQLGIDYNAPGGPRFYRRSGLAMDRNYTIARFNNGIVNPESGEREFYDGIIMTRAGATGISLNASNAFINRKQREMLLPQAPLDINEYIQLLGRIYRANMDLEKVPPIYTTVLLDLPAERRPAAMLLKKQSMLSANVTSNSESFSNLDATDMMNWLGDTVALEYLKRHPYMASKLQLDLNQEIKDGEKAQDTGLMSRLTARGVLLTCNEFEDLYGELEDEYQRRLNQMIEKGENPFRTREYDLKARESARFVFEGDEEFETVFDAPIYLSEIEYEESMNGMEYEAAVRRMEHAIQRHGEQPLLAHRALYLQHHGQRVQALLERLGVENEEELVEKFPNQKEQIERLRQEPEHFLNLCDSGALRFGQAYRMEEDGEARDLYFVGFKVRDERRMGYASNYLLQFAVPGREFLLEMSLLSFMEYGREGEIRPAPGKSLMDEMARREFEEAPRGKVTRRRCVLNGNLMAAAEWSSDHGMGVPAVIVMESGERMRGIVLPKGVEARTMLYRPMRLTRFDMILEYLHMRSEKRDPHVICYPDSNDGSRYIRLSRDDQDDWELKILGRQQVQKEILRDERLSELADGEEFEGRSVMRMRIHGSARARAVVDYLYERYGLVFSTPETDPEARYDFYLARAKRKEAENVEEADLALLDMDGMEVA